MTAMMICLFFATMRSEASLDTVMRVISATIGNKRDYNVNLKGPLNDYNVNLKGPLNDYNVNLKGPLNDYNVNLEGPLNAQLGYGWSKSNYLHYKRFLSYGIRIESNCSCDSCRERDEAEARNDLDGVHNGQNGMHNDQNGMHNGQNVMHNGQNGMHNEMEPVGYRFVSKKDTAFELYNNQNYRNKDKDSKFSVEQDFVFDFHKCLSDMFVSSSRCITTDTGLVSSFSYMLNVVVDEADVRKLFAILYLLPENLGLEANVTFVNGTGDEEKTSGKENDIEDKENDIEDKENDIEDKENDVEDKENDIEDKASGNDPTDQEKKFIVSDCPGCTFKINYNLKNRDGGLTHRDSVRRIVGFFKRCGTKEGFREAIRKKIQAGKDDNCDATYILETPHFLMQAYTWERYKLNSDALLEIAEHIHTILRNKIAEGHPRAQKVFDRYFTKSSGKRAQEIAAFKEYKDKMDEIYEIYSEVLFSPLRTPIRARLSHFYNRHSNQFMGPVFGNCVEISIFSIFCALFYNREAKRFVLPPVQGRLGKNRRRLYELFTNTINTPEDVYAQSGNALAESISRILGDLPGHDIRYWKCTATSIPREDGTKKSVVVRNELQCGLLNILSVMARVTGNHDAYYKRIDNAKRLRDDEEACDEALKITGELFESLSSMGSLNIELSNLSRQIIKDESMEGKDKQNTGEKDKDEAMYEIYCEIHFYHNNCKSSKIIVEIEEEHLEVGYELPPDINIRSQYNGLLELHKKINLDGARSFATDLLCKTIEYNSNVIFRGTEDIHFSEGLCWIDRVFRNAEKTREDPKEIDQSKKKTVRYKTIDHILPIGDMIGTLRYCGEILQSHALILDRIRPLVLGKPSVEKMKLCNLMINILICGASRLINFGESFALFILMFRDVKIDALRRFEHCEHWRNPIESLEKKDNKALDFLVFFPPILGSRLLGTVFKDDLENRMASLAESHFLNAEVRKYHTEKLLLKIWRSFIYDDSGEIATTIRSAYPRGLNQLLGLVHYCISCTDPMISEAYYIIECFVTTVEMNGTAEKIMWIACAPFKDYLLESLSPLNTQGNLFEHIMKNGKDITLVFKMLGYVNDNLDDPHPHYKETIRKIYCDCANLWNSSFSSTPS